MDVYLRLLSFLRPYRARIGVALVATFVLAGATSLYAFLLGPLVKVLLTPDATPPQLPLIGALSHSQLLLALPIALVAVALVRVIAQGTQSYLMQWTGQCVVADLRHALYGRYLAMPQAWLSRQQSGDLVSRFGSDVQAVEFGLTNALSNAVKDGTQVLALLVVCASLEWRLFLAAMALVPLAAWPLARYARGLKRVSDRCQTALGSLIGQVGESIANVRVVQSFNREDDELKRFDATQGGYVGWMRRSYLLRSAFSPIVEILGVLGLAAAIYFAGSAIARGELTGETLLSFLAAMLLMYRPTKELSHTGTLVIQGLAGGRRVFEVLDSPERLPEPERAEPVRFEREVAFREVDFSYGDEAVLRGVALTLRRGQTLALVGESGSGKSTLAALLLRFYDPTAGALEIDGRDLRTMTLADLRRLIAFVPQEPVLFAGTIRDNVGCAREGAVGDTAIVAALQAAHAWEFVSEMPGALDATVGERGAGLSGGQRQRIALARAFLADAPIIVLDEATSALDGASEGLVQDGLERLLADRTALVIAHRLSTIAAADTIAVLSRGVVVETGRHTALLEAGGAYAALWSAQAGAPAQPPMAPQARVADAG